MKAVICGKRLFWQFMLWALKDVVLSDQAQLNVALLQLFRSIWKSANVLQNCWRELQRLHQRFCSTLQLELSCCLASKMLLNSCNLAVQLFWSDFVALYSAASFVRGEARNMITHYLKISRLQYGADLSINCKLIVLHVEMIRFPCSQPLLCIWCKTYECKTQLKMWC